MQSCIYLQHLCFWNPRSSCVLQILSSAKMEENTWTLCCNNRNISVMKNLLLIRMTSVSICRIFKQSCNVYMQSFTVINVFRLNVEHLTGLYLVCQTDVQLCCCYLSNTYCLLPHLRYVSSFLSASTTSPPPPHPLSQSENSRHVTKLCLFSSYRSYRPCSTATRSTSFTETWRWVQRSHTGLKSVQ